LNYLLTILVDEDTLLSPFLPGFSPSRERRKHDYLLLFSSCLSHEAQQHNGEMLSFGKKLC
jgi:hypothetical protein